MEPDLVFYPNSLKRKPFALYEKIPYTFPKNHSRLSEKKFLYSRMDAEQVKNKKNV